MRSSLRAMLSTKIAFFVLISAIVILGQSQAVVIRNIGCKKFEKDVCVQCVTRYWMDNRRICQPVNPNCRTYNQMTGGCLSCYAGFGIIEDTCLPGVVTNSFDANCNKFEDGVCVKCSFGFFLDQSGKCRQADISCRTFDDVNGRCTSCFAGFEVQSGTCVVSRSSQSLPNCNQIDSATGRCRKCSFGFYFDANGNCIQSDPNCKSFDSIAARCRQCYPGYQLNPSFQCVKGKEAQRDQNCAQYDFNNICKKCSIGSFFNSQGRCITSDPSCLTFSNIDGRCLTCYSGYRVQGRTCVRQQTADNPNPFCARWQGNTCLQCARGSYFDRNRICIIVDANCKQVRQNACISCYNGYTLSNNECVKSTPQPTSDQYCAQFFGDVCVKCSTGSFMNEMGKCTVVNPLCRTFSNINGDCLSCFPGFQLISGRCREANNTKITDANCKQFLTDDICSVCSQRYYLGEDGLCQEVNPLCRTFDKINGNCLSCFPGFELRGNECRQSVQSLTDPNCKQWRGDRCVACSFGAYFAPNGRCVMADPLCRTFNSSNGRCTSCYASFDLRNGQCIKQANQTLSDANCAQFLQGICVKCSQGFIFQANGLCSLVSASCRTFDRISGDCLSCYQGFYLQRGSCLRGDDNSSAIDPYCASFVTGICVKCSRNFFFGQDGLCKAVNPLCKTFNPINGNCLTCYQSYVLDGANCVQDVNQASTDPNCASFLDGVCTSCALRTYLDDRGFCAQVSIDCNTYDGISGQCTSCYAGFALQRGRCNKSSAPNSCSRFDARGNCVQCGPGSYLRQGACLLIDTQCANFDQNAQVCTACYPGYSILNGACQISQVQKENQIQNCYAYNQQSKCIQCFDRFYLSRNQCLPVDVFCKTYDQKNGNCLSCYTSFKLLAGKCTQ